MIQDIITPQAKHFANLGAIQHTSEVFRIVQFNTKPFQTVLDADQSELLSTLLLKFICGDALELYSNEIKGVDELDWKSFPEALIVSEDAITCGGIGDRIAAIGRPSISLDRGL